jgi:uncharacterized protein
MSKNFRILSIDGGGMRGIVPLEVLKFIEQRYNKKIYELFDFIAGTSTGGLIACGLVVSDDGKTPKFSLKELENIYLERGKEIFPSPFALIRIFRFIRSLKSPKFKEEGLEKVLIDVLGNKRITNCIKPILIPTYDLYNNNALLFKSRHAELEASKNALLIDVCRATSAAPTYFPAYKFTFDGRPTICIDGGIFMNNPSMGALAEIYKHFNSPIYNLTKPELDNIKILSLGTGNYTPEIARKKVENWGLLDWATQISDLMLQANNQVAHYQAEQIIQENNFLRLDIEIKEEKYSAIDKPKTETFDYLKKEINDQIFNNGTLIKKMDGFFNGEMNVPIVS